jgi:hypothetical protein
MHELGPWLGFEPGCARERLRGVLRQGVRGLGFCRLSSAAESFLNSLRTSRGLITIGASWPLLRCFIFGA